jgi:hypothetical protein
MARLQLVDSTGETQEIEVRIHRKLFEPPDKSRTAIMGETSVPGRQAKTSRLIALALRFETLLQDGAAKDHAEVARWGGVTRSRISQILNLRNLAPAIQEELLLEQPGRGLPITERTLQRLTQQLDWRQQIAKFQELRRPESQAEPDRVRS